MTMATLSSVLQPAVAGGYAVCGLVCLGWEDARAFVRAAEAEGLPVILQAGPSCRAHTPLRVLGPMFRALGEMAAVPVVAHLDHGASREECREAIECGFTSVMYDGSQTPLEKNIADTAEIAAMAQAAGACCEGEIGFVGYATGETSRGTDPDEAKRFAAETGVDAMAISVGNVHLQERHEGVIDLARIRAIEAVTNVPLVIHGGSGIPHVERGALARDTRIAKFNIGTELRQVFGQSLRDTLSGDAALYDRVKILSAVEAPLQVAARRALRAAAPDGLRL
ncbi:MAG: class II fructose-bisphosphate aldolase [Pseudomonadota bacterium]